MYREVGKLWNDETKIIISNNLKYYVLNKTKGDDIYHECWEVLDEEGRKKADSDKTFTIKAIYEYSKESNKKILVDYNISDDEDQRKMKSANMIEE